MNITGDRVLSPLSRILTSVIFVAGGVDKLRNREKNKNYMASKNLPLIPVLLGGAAITEIAAGLGVLLGRKQKLAAASLAFYLIPTSLIFHDFWKKKGMEREMEMINFMKNLAIIGGLVEIARHELPRRHGVSSSTTRTQEDIEKRVMNEPLPEAIEIIEVEEKVA